MLLTIGAAILVIGVLIFVHELGRFIAAKAVGIGVPRFSIGLGPKVAGFRPSVDFNGMSGIYMGNDHVGGPLNFSAFPTPGNSFNR